MRIVFFGSDEFAAQHLRALLAADHDVPACVTGPDKPHGRGMKLEFSPIKQMALDARIPCLQPPSLKEPNIIETLKSYRADIFVVVAYGYLLTRGILDIPQMLCINVHGSLLPKYRGAAPVNWAVLNGDKVTGVTIQKMVLGLDAGDIIAQEAMAIEDDESAAQVLPRMASAGAKLLVKVLDENPGGRFPLKPQEEHLVTWAPKLNKEMGRVDWKKTAATVHNQVRGLQPWPGTYTFYNGKMLKITRTRLTGEDVGGCSAGQVTKTDKNGFYVACSDKALLISEVQPQAGRVMSAQSFTAGHKIIPGFLLG
ncbi:MAG: methionyl-tRNA formyltransferase [Candidatus Omnitrophica bacterium]|nr:methionyl-tRNA formyltransferase [Candidatus Omnitrophota bacterium]MDE2214723.1 methionyl-tRNA formyltransferase [Candidatus Omnitrophota bacterium]